MARYVPEVMKRENLSKKKPKKPLNFFAIALPSLSENTPLSTEDNNDDRLKKKKLFRKSMDFIIMTCASNN